MFLRYMQEAALRASAAVDYDSERYDELGYFWLIRETQLEILAPLGVGDKVQVKTWVQDFRRVRSRRQYTFSLEDGSPIAEAHSDWVFLERESLRPAMIPEAMLTAFMPDWAEQDRPTRDPFPKLEPMDAVSRYSRTVEWRDLDSAAHVNNAIYLDYFETGLRRMLSPSVDLSGGGSIQICRLRIEYLQQAVLDETLEISSWRAAAQGDTATSGHEVRRSSDGERLTRALVGFTTDLDIEGNYE